MKKQEQFCLRDLRNGSSILRSWQKLTLGLIQQASLRQIIYNYIIRDPRVDIQASQMDYLLFLSDHPHDHVWL